VDRSGDEAKIAGQEGFMKRLLALIAMVIVSLSASAQAQAPTRKAKMIGIVLPNDVRPGERASGSVILYPGALSGIPGLQVAKTKVEIDENQPRKATLSGIVIDAGGQKRNADQNFAVDVPADAKSVHVMLWRNDQQIGAVDVPIEAATAKPLVCGSGEWVNGTEQDGSQSQFHTPPTYCYAGMAVIAGSFSGDAQQTRIEDNGQAARIVAESQRYCYWLLPRTASPGLNKITLYEGPHTVTFNVTIPRLDLLQVLEAGVPSMAQAAPATGSAASESPASSLLPLGLGIGVGAGGMVDRPMMEPRMGH
jgi:hypothetical protein